MAPLGKHEVKQGDREDISNMNSAYLVLKFTLWCAEVATTIINTGQPPPPVSTQGAPHDNTRPPLVSTTGHGNIHKASGVDTRGTLW